ncbi:MAG: BspA family leucine-rich repeat surface protein, partial [Bacteroidetes bacterium]
MTKVYTFNKTFAWALAGAMFVIFGSTKLLAQESWGYVGTFNFSGTSIDRTDIEFSSTGEPHVAYSAGIQLSVKRFNGSSWETVGTENFAFLSPLADALAPSLALDGMDVPYVAFIDLLDGLRVMKFDGTNWVDVGATGFINANKSPSLAIYNNEPYVAAADNDNGGNLTMKKFDGTNWVTIGFEGFSDQAEQVQLAFSPAGIPTVAYVNPGTNSVNVMTYEWQEEFMDVLWSFVGSGNITDQTDFLSLAVGGANESEYIAFQDGNAGNMASVMRFSGTAWEYVGAQGVSDGAIEYTSLAIFENEPYLAYGDEANGGGVTVKKFSGGVWETIGSEAFTAHGPLNLNLALYHGQPFVSYRDNDAGTGSGASVMKYDCFDNRYDLNIVFDNFPGDISWEVKNLVGETVASEGPYNFLSAGDTLDVSFCLADGCYEFIINDSYGDGLCCAQGNGFYTLTNAQGDTLAQGAEFSFSETTQICVAMELPKAVIASPEGTALNCYGGSLLLDGSNSFGDNNLSYQWEDATQTIIGTDPTVAVTAAGTYYLQVTDEVTMETDLDSVQITEAGNLFLNINFDDYPGDISWDLAGNNGFFMSGGPYTDEPAGSTLTIPFCAESDCYNLNIYDSFGDGLCCAWGDGAYSITNLTGDTLAMGAVFDTLETSFFCLVNSPTAIINPLQGTEVNCHFPEITLDGSGSNGENSLTYEWTDGISVLGTDPTFTVDDSGVYYLIATDAVNLSSDTASVAITGGPPFLATEIFPTVAHLDCDNPSSTLLVGIFNAQGAINYLWSNDSTSDEITVNAGGTYSVTVTDTANGCEATHSVVISEAVIGCTPFITTWETTASNESVTVPAYGTGFGYNIDWGDGTLETGLTGPAMHTYSSPGVHTVSITGELTNTSFQTTGDSDKLQSIEQWGTIEWTTFEYGFRYCTNLVINASDAPDLSNVTSMHWAFSDCTSLNSDISFWNMSNIQSTRNMFNGATSFNQPLNSWDVSNVTDMGGMFNGAISFNQPLDMWDVSSVSDMIYLFNAATSFNQPLNMWDVSGATLMFRMFNGASSFDQNLGDWDISNVTNMDLMLSGSGLSIQNYDNTLIGWANGPVLPNITLGATGLKYCLGEDARTSLINDDGWTINGDSNGCMALTCPVDVTEAACQSQAAVDAAFANWLATVAVNGGCNPQVTNNAAGAPNAATGGSVTVTFSATDDCSGAGLQCMASFTVEAPTVTAMIDVPSTQLDCNTTSITLDASGSSGQGSLSYMWTGGSTGPTLDVMSPGDYFVTVTDAANGCTDVTSVTVTESGTSDNSVLISITFDDYPQETSWEIRDTSGALIASGGLYPDEPDGSTLNIPLCIPDGCYDFIIFDTAGDGLCCGYGIGSYIVTDVDGDIIAGGAEFTLEETTSFCLPFIPMDPDIVILTPQGTVLDCNINEVTLDASTSTGDHQLEYIWSDESFATIGTDPVLMVNEPGTYQLQLSDLVTGATDLELITITENYTEPTAMIDAPTTQLDCETGSITLDATGSSGQGALSFEWTGGSTGSTLEVTAAGEYFVTVTDAANGCSSVDNILITESTEVPWIQAGAAPTTELNCIYDFSILWSTGGGTTGEGVTLVWSNGYVGSGPTVTEPGIYTVTITDLGNGCTNETSVTITENITPPTPDISAPATHLDCNNPSILLDASGSTGQGTLSYEWNTGGGPTPDAQYEFENNTNDSAGANNGTAQNGPTYIAGQVGQAIDLDGINQHVTLPSGMFDTYNDFSFAAWVNWDGSGSSLWERIFDFGNNTSQYMVLSPNGWPNNLRFVITTSGAGGQQGLASSTPLPINEWTHVSIVLDGDTGTLYVNGSVVDSGTITIDPSDIAPMLNYFGRSQFPDGPHFDGQIDDV